MKEGRTKLVLIIDDDATFAALLGSLFGNYKPEWELLFADSVEKAVILYNTHSPDFIFLDIYMPVMDGFNFLDLIIPRPGLKVIICSGEVSNAVRSFSYSVLDFILKPVTPKRFLEVLKRLDDAETDQEKATKDFIVVNRHDKVFFIKKSDIIRVEAKGAYCEFSLPDTKIVASRPLNHFLSLLDEKEFVRLSRSTVLNVKHIKEILKYSKNTGNLHLTNGEVVYLSKQKKDYLIQLLSE